MVRSDDQSDPWREGGRSVLDGSERLVIWIFLVVFIIIQMAILFAVYRVILRPIPGQIHELLYERHLKNEFTQISTDTADLVRSALLKLEEERLETAMAYEAVKGGRNLNTTEKAERDAKKKAIERLTKQIDGTRNHLEKFYAPPVLSHLRKFEELRLVTALNSLIDETSKRGRG